MVSISSRRGNPARRPLQQCLSLPADHVILLKKELVLGKLKIDSGLFSHQPQTGSGITGMHTLPPQHPQCPETGCLGSRTPCPFLSLAVRDGDMSWQPSKGSSSQPAIPWPCSPRLPQQRQRRPLLRLRPAQSRLGAQPCASREACRERGHALGTYLGDTPGGMNRWAGGSRLRLSDSVIPLQLGAISDIPPGYRMVQR